MPTLLPFCTTYNSRFPVLPEGIFLPICLSAGVCKTASPKNAIRTTLRRRISAYDIPVRSLPLFLRSPITFQSFPRLVQCSVNASGGKYL